MNFTKKSINELINTVFHCTCGKDHCANIQNIAIGKDAIKKMPPMIDCQVLKNGKVFDKTKDLITVVSDVNTEAAAGKAVKALLEDLGYRIESYVLPHKEMHAEEKYAKEIDANLSEETKLLIAVGSGSLNDMARYVAFARKMPYYIVATAPSMDGYASNVSPLVHNNLKITYPAECAAAIIGDTGFLATAPAYMIAAGLGDILCKYLCINDWKMSSIINQEYFCPEVADLVLFSVEKCISNIKGLQNREDDALQYLMESLVLIGIAMSYIGYSRPASSSEHHIAHLLEMKSIFAGEYGELHGTNVGVATCILEGMVKDLLTMDFDYDMAREKARRFNLEEWEKEIHHCYGIGAEEVIKLYHTARQNEPEEVVARINAIEANEKELRSMLESVLEQLKPCPEMLKSLDGLTDFSTYSFSKEELIEILTYAKDVRSRYGLLQIFYDLGVLETLCTNAVATTPSRES